MKILFSVAKAFHAIYKPFVKEMEALGAEVTCLLGDEFGSKETVIREIKDADIYILAVAEVDREVIDAASSLKYIIKLGTGVDNIDIAYAAQKGIAVSNAPGQNAASVAELTLGLMLALSRKIPQLDEKTKNGEWIHSMGSELGEKTLGLIGFGTIGKKIAHYASVFDMRCIAFGHYKDYQTANELHVEFVEWDKLLSQSDYIVVSTSLKKTNYHLINRTAIAMMKPSAYLINVSRGAIVDEKALFKAVKLKKIAGAGLDVLEFEPSQDPLPVLDRLIFTPHIGGSTLESVWRIAQVTIENIRRFSQNKPLLYIVNQKSLVNEK